MDWVPEASRRARGIPIYAVLRQLGRAGIAELVENCCRLAEQMAARLRDCDGVSVLNDVVLNQVLVRFEAAGVNVTPAVMGISPKTVQIQMGKALKALRAALAAFR